MRVCPHRIGEEIEFNDSTDPNALWASTQWTQITDGRVTLASSSSHALGDTGGSETHTLTVSEMPSHRHGIGTNFGSAGTATTTWSYTASMMRGREWNNDANNAIQNVGGGGAHNNMQPWRAVNRWRRVA